MSLAQKLEKHHGRLNHALGRVEDRYDAALGHSDLILITNALATAQYKDVRVIETRKQTCNRHYYHIEYGNRRYKLIWAPKQKAICTFLPIEATGRGYIHDRRLFRSFAS